jgi:hypothetical protein
MMQRLYFNFQKGDVRLVSLEVCPSIEDETSFPNADIPDDVTMEMISFKAVEGRLDPVITYPSIPITAQPESGGTNGQP